MLTKKAEEKVKEILSEQPEPYAGLRIQVVGGGCSGFSYRMGFDKNYNDQSDAIFEFDGLKVFVDKSSFFIWTAPKSTTSRVCTARALNSVIRTQPALAAAAARLAYSVKNCRRGL